MKKNIIFLMMCFFCIAANAQFYLGGSFQFSTNNSKLEGESVNTTAFTFEPELGYQFNNWFSLGTVLGVGHVNPGGDSSDYTIFEFSPYARATFAHVGAVDFFADAEFSYAWGNLNDLDVSIDGWGLALCPGIQIKLTDRWKLQGKTTLFEHSQVGDDVKMKQTGFNLFDDFSLGIIYKF